MAWEPRVRQDSYSAFPDGVQAEMRANRRGELVVPDFLQQLVMDGRVYQINNAAIETAGAIGQTSFATNGTNPAILVDVPAGTTIFPVEIRLAQGGTIANDAFTVVIAFEEGLRYSSAGTARTPQNLRTDNPNTSACPAYDSATAIVATAPTNDNLLHAGIYTQMVADPVHSDQSIFWSARQFLAPVLVGPASLLIYAYVATTGPSLFYRVVWAEIASVSAK